LLRHLGESRIAVCVQEPACTVESESVDDDKENALERLRGDGLDEGALRSGYSERRPDEVGDRDDREPLVVGESNRTRNARRNGEGPKTVQSSSVDAHDVRIIRGLRPLTQCVQWAGTQCVQWAGTQRVQWAATRGRGGQSARICFVRDEEDGIRRGGDRGRALRDGGRVLRGEVGG